MERPKEEDCKYPYCGDAHAVDYAEYSGFLELYADSLEKEIEDLKKSLFKYITKYGSE